MVNRSRRKLLEWRTPYEALTGCVPDVSHFCVFGCRAWVHNNKGKKLDAKSIPMIFVGYESGSKAYHLWDPKSHQIVISDVKFNEEEFPALPPPEPVTPIPSSSRDTLPFQWSEGASKKQVNFVDLPEIFALFNEEVRHQRPQVSHITPTTGTPGRGSMPAFTTPVLRPTELPESPIPDQRESEEEVSNDLKYQSSDDSSSSSSSSSDEEQPLPPPPVTTFPTPSTPAVPLSKGYVSPDPESVYNKEEDLITKSRGQKQRRKKVERYEAGKRDSTLNQVEIDELKALDTAYENAVKLFVSGTTSTPKEPCSYREAVNPNNPDSPSWVAAINAELDSLREHGTWEYVPRPKDKPIVSCKWVWHVKVKSDGSVEQFKAHLVARGFTQTRGVDYNKTFAPVTCLDTLRLLAAMAVQNNWEFRHLDVKTAYLHGDLEEEVYMAVPQGLEDVPEGYILKLKKALYGLKQAGRQWYEHLRATMKVFGLTRAKSDPHTFVFNRKIKGVTHTLIIPVYVDDIFLFGSKTLADQFEEYIPKYYDITDPCDAQYLLGIRVTRKRSGQHKYIMLDQVRFAEQTISNIVQYYGEVKERNTILPAEDLVPNPEPKEDSNPGLVRTFQSAVGQLMYLMMATQPDIAYAVGMLARHASNPSNQHISAIIHLAGYLMKTKQWSLTYRWQTEMFENRINGHRFLRAYTDADWAGEEHSGRSTSGYIFLLSGSAISWSSKRQGCVSRSTMESKYIGLFNCTCQFNWFSSLLQQLEHPLPNKQFILCNNQSAIHITNGAIMDFKRSHYMNVKYHWVRNQVKENDCLTVEYVPSKENVADIMTKQLNTSLHWDLACDFIEDYNEVLHPEQEGIQLVSSDEDQ